MLLMPPLVRTPILRLSALLGAGAILGSLAAGCGAPASSESNATELSPAQTEGRQSLTGHVSSAMAKARVVGVASPSKTLTLTIGLPVRDPEALRLAVEQVSDPASPLYRRYLEPDTFADRFGASREEYQALVDWARSKELAVVTHSNRLVAQVTGAVPAIEAALHIKMVTALRPDGSEFYRPDAEPSVDLSVPIEHIGNLDNYVLPKSAGGSGPGGSRKGTDFRNAYASCTGMDGTGQTIGILMVDGFTQSDITTYFQPATPLPVKTIPVNTGIDSFGSAEGTLDIEMALAMAPKAQIVAFTGDTDAILANMAGQIGIKQFSSSWFIPTDSTAKTLLAELALQGQSFFQASGDAGACAPGYFSADNDVRLQPAVTNVGGTALNMNGAGASYGTESAWSGSSGMILSYSGGGGVPIPSYQVGLATAANQASSMYRNVPDVSAEASYVDIFYNGASVQVGGTSAATPLWAGFMALVNQRAQAIGQPSIGFANPALYAIAKSSAYGTTFNDITVGSAPGAGGFSYSTTPGYDMVTGLGSPQCGLVNALTPIIPGLCSNPNLAPANATLALGAHGSSVSVTSPSSTYGSASCANAFIVDVTGTNASTAQGFTLNATWGEALPSTKAACPFAVVGATAYGLVPAHWGFGAGGTFIFVPAAWLQLGSTESAGGVWTDPVPPGHLQIPSVGCHISLNVAAPGAAAYGTVRVAAQAAAFALFSMVPKKVTLTATVPSLLW